MRRLTHVPRPRGQERPELGPKACIPQQFTMGALSETESPRDRDSRRYANREREMKEESDAGADQKMEGGGRWTESCHITPEGCEETEGALPLPPRPGL